MATDQNKLNRVKSEGAPYDRVMVKEILRKSMVVSSILIGCPTLVTLNMSKLNLVKGAFSKALIANDCVL